MTTLLCRLISLAALRNWLQPEKGYHSLFHLPIKWWRKLKRYRLRWLPEAEIRPGDLLVMLDLGLDMDWTVIDHLRASGVIVGGVVYDLEPVRHPGFFKDDVSSIFPEWLKNIGSRHDFTMAISETVRQHLIEYYYQNRILPRMSPDRIVPFRLGSDLDGVNTKNPSPQTIRPELREKLQNRIRPTILNVGTIEPRKNHQLLLDAFDAALEKGADICCVIAGIIGWKCDEIVQRIQSHPELGRRLLVYHDLTDQELQFTYASVDALVYPTHAEGYGLPITEAMVAGLPVIASDIPILRETSGNNGIFVSTTDPAELTMALVQLSRGELEFPVPANIDSLVISWKECTINFLHQIVRFSSTERERQAA